MTGEQMRAALLRVVAERAGLHTLQAGSVLNEASRHLGRLTREQEQALLTLWGDLFRTGYLAWGYDIANADPPFCHVTEQGRAALRTLSRDPANPDGYLQYLRSKASINAVAASYLSEALATYNGGHHKAAAVMIGAAAEAVVLDLRDALAAKLDELKQKHPTELGDWRIKRVLGALQKFMEEKAKAKSMPPKLAEAIETHWPAFAQQIRAVRNEAGHPTSIDPVTHDSVHASLLIFPELAAIADQIHAWIAAGMK